MPDEIYDIKIGGDLDPEQLRQERLKSVLPQDQQVSKKFRLFLEIVINVAVAAILYFFIKNYLIAPFRVVGPSMCDTLNVVTQECTHGKGEYLVLNKAVYADFFGRRFGAPSRGDIVVFHPPGESEDFFIKRIIGLPGETVEFKQGNVFVNGRRLSESYLNENNAGRTHPGSKTLFRVPSGGYFVMGDNRLESVDSRNCFADRTLGDCASGRPFYLTIDEIQGKAWFVLLPFANIRVIDSPDYGDSADAM